MDCVEVTAENYAANGVHKGMQGWICDPRCIQGHWLVNFPQSGENEDIATIPVRETDLKEITEMYATVNEKIRAELE